MASVSRRRFIKEGAHRAGVLLTILFVSSKCREKKVKDSDKAATGDSQDPCSDLSSVPESDVELRRKFAYVKESPIADNHCHNCNLYLPPKDASPCGSCMLFKGPVNANGYCTYWAPKIT